MKLIILIYVIFINLLAFILMGIDKWKAQHHKWRIPEKTLFLTALLFGSPGMLAGMYIFRHKTKHLSFKIGIPLILLLQIVLISCLFFKIQKTQASPQYAVEAELKKIRKQDPDTILSIISFDNLENSAFFSNFQYHIDNCYYEESSDPADTATVETTISNIDMQALAKDLGREILRQSLTIYEVPAIDYGELLTQMIEENDYDTVSSPVSFHLKKENGLWNIIWDEALQNELSGGFISAFEDPYLLSSPEVLSLTLDAFKEMNGEQWSHYLGKTDIFSIYNEEYTSQVDQAYIQKIAENFDYQILKNESDELIDVRIYSADMSSILSAYRQALIDYAHTPASLKADSQGISDESSRLLLQAIQESSSRASFDIQIKMTHNGTSWEAILDEDFANALMGGMQQALAVFEEENTTTKETELFDGRY